MYNYGYYNDAVFPWHESDDDRKFKKIVRRSLVVFIIIGLVFPFLPTPEIEKKQLKQVSPRLAKLIVKKKEEKKIVKKVAEKKKDLPKKKKKAIKKEVKKEVKKKIEKSGVLAFSNELANLRDSFDMGKIEKTRNVKTTTKNYNASRLISKSANSLSGGVNKSRLTTATVDQKLEGHATSSVSSNIAVAKASPIDGGGGSPGKSGRTREEIETIFQKYKGAFYSMYNRALRKDPALQGRVVVELTISPSGAVTAARIVSTQLGNKALERKIIARVKLMRFNARNVSTVTVKYPIDFFPS